MKLVNHSSLGMAPNACKQKGEGLHQVLNSLHFITFHYMIAWPDLGVVITPPLGLNPEAIGGKIPRKPGNFESLKPEAAAWGALPAFLQTECKPKMNRLASPKMNTFKSMWRSLEIAVTPVLGSNQAVHAPDISSRASHALHKAWSSEAYFIGGSGKRERKSTFLTFVEKKLIHISYIRTPVTHTEPEVKVPKKTKSSGSPMGARFADWQRRVDDSKKHVDDPGQCWSKQHNNINIIKSHLKTISNPFTDFDVASKLYSASKWQHTKELSVWPSVQVPQLPPEHENSMSLRLWIWVSSSLTTKPWEKKSNANCKPIQLALQKAESTERFSAFSLHVKRRRKVRSCVLPVLLLQHKDMSCGANLYQLYHWGNPMCSEDTPSNLTRICSGKFLKCQNADNLYFFRQCRRKSSSHPSQLQTLLKTACVCTQGVWFKGIDDIHQHLVSLGKFQHIFLFIRSKV